MKTASLLSKNCCFNSMQGYPHRFGGETRPRSPKPVLFSALWRDMESTNASRASTDNQIAVSAVDLRCLQVRGKRTSLSGTSTIVTTWRKPPNLPRVAKLRRPPHQKTRTVPLLSSNPSEGTQNVCQTSTNSARGCYVTE